MATRKRTTNTPPADQMPPQDASRYRRSEYADGGVAGPDQDFYRDQDYRRAASQYSRYNAGAYSAPDGAGAYDGAYGQEYGGAEAPFEERSYGRRRLGRAGRVDSASAYDDFSYADGAETSFSSGQDFQSDDLDDSGRYSRNAYANGSSKRTKRKRRVRFRAALIALALLLLVGAGGAFAYVSYVNGNLSEGLDSNLKNVLVKSSLTKEPSYMLLLGTDASLERENDESYAETFRTDTILLARIDPVDQKVTLISMPRDTMIDMGEDGTQKLNAAYAIGGADAAVEEVADLAGVGISHFCLIDMDGLTSIVDALGGIEVDVPMEIDDADAGGHLDAGVQTLDGEQALILCRSRNAFEDYGAGDLYRAANQRLVLQAIASKILSSDVATIAESVTAITEFVSTDLSVREIIGLAQAFQGLDTQSSIYTDSMPTTSEYVDDLWYEVVDEDAWQTMMERVDAGLPPEENTVVDERAGVTLANSGDGGSGSTDVSAHSGTVSVRNGTDYTGAGSSALVLLEEDGYTVVDAADADAIDYETTLVVYEGESCKAEAEAIAELLGSSAKAVENDGTYSTQCDFLVIIGADLAADITERGMALSEKSSSSSKSSNTAGEGYSDEDGTGYSAEY